MSSQILKVDTVVLFWFYKEIPLCLERIQHFKKLNPGVTIYGLYGGDVKSTDKLKDINEELDHLYIYEKECTAHWKWMNGDQMLVDWYRCIGFKLNWKNVFILQWDLVMYQPLDFYIGEIKENQYFIPGVRDISEVKAWWPWFRAESIDSFKNYLSKTMDYRGSISCSLFICALLPRAFFEYFKEIDYPEDYFLEYKIPTILNAIGYEPFDAVWGAPYWAEELIKDYVSVENRNLIAVGHSIPIEVVKKNLNLNRHSIFHPCYVTLSELEGEEYDLSIVEKLKLFRMNIISYAKFWVKKLIKYNRKERSGLLTLIK